MTDEAVGELWWKALNEEGSYSAQTEMALIRKLVEERANKHYGHGVDWNEATECALRDFGINKESWEAEP